MKHAMSAEDALQETFIQVFHNIHQYKGEGAFVGWLRRIAVTTCLKALRKNEIQTEELNLVKEEHSDGESFPDMNMEVDEILLIINTLPDNYRHVFNLYIVEGYSHLEIAEILGINEAASRARLKRARIMVRDAINKKNLIYEIAEARKAYTK
jgi:RNA polymerase sigma-70 factor (ECF subfamily)